MYVRIRNPMDTLSLLYIMHSLFLAQMLFEHMIFQSLNVSRKK